METMYTRKASYELIQPKLSRMQQMVYQVIKDYDRPMSASEIAKVLYRWDITDSPHRSKAAPRCTELDRKFGAIKAVDVRECEATGRPEALYITTEKHLENLRKEREKKPVQISLFAGGRGYSG